MFLIDSMLQWVTTMVHVILDVMFEMLIYMFVDVITKNTLRDASEVSEKRAIWLVEVCVLLILACLMWVLHHTPFVLFTLTLLTLAYTQLLERVNFRYLWLTLWTKWDEFQQHEESMGRLNELRSHQVAQGYTNLNGRWAMPPSQPPPPPPPNATPFMGYDPSMGAPSEAWYPADSERSHPKMVALSEPPVGYAQTTSTARPGSPMAMSPAMPGYNRMPDYMMQTASMQQRALPTCSYSPILPRGRQLARRPLHSYLQSPVSPPPPTTFKTRVMTALGMNRYLTTTPGLRNNGENICFMNSILQCLAHSPGLAAGLSQDQEQPQGTPAQIALVTSLTELLERLAVMPGMSQLSVADPDPVRQAASGLPGSMVAHPKKHQEQQDAAEFLMWLLEALHSALNTGSSTSQGGDIGTGSNLAPWAVPRYTSVTLNMLRFIYGDLTPQRITELKAACRKEMELAGGLDVTGYGEAVQRLADLEWLTYKESEQSIVDDLFTGQLVEALHCTACSRLTVDIQTFKILPVPIGQPRSLNGLVRLEDCFTKFGTIEELYGPDGLQCECCNRRRATLGNGTGRDNSIGAQIVGTPASSVYGAQPSQRHPSDAAYLVASPILPNGLAHRHRVGDMVRRRKLLSDSAIHSSIGAQSTEMSPIAAGPSDILNDSGFQDNLMPTRGVRTSTPIHSTGPPVQLTDGQRRSLLRQLPECLIVQLMRFSYAGGQPVKVHRPVNLPLTGLDLTPLIVDTVMQRPDVTASSNTHRYDLYSLCLHRGADATASGHYISYGKALDGNWYRYDDADVTAVNMDYELSTRLVRENAYLAFYRRTTLS